MNPESDPTDEELIEFAKEFIYIPGIWRTKLYDEVYPAVSCGRLSKKRRTLLKKLMPIYDSIKEDPALRKLDKEGEDIESKISDLRQEFFRMEDALRMEQKVIRRSQAEAIKVLLLVNGINLEE